MKNIFAKISVVVALFAMVMIFVAGISGDNGTLWRLIMSSELKMKYTAFMSASGTTGTSYARFADTSSFATPTGLFTKAIYVPGATTKDVYALTKRVIAGTSTAKPTDTTTLFYMAKTDSLIVMRDDTTTSGLKFSWIRVKLN